MKWLNKSTNPKGFAGQQAQTRRAFRHGLTVLALALLSALVAATHLLASAEPQDPHNHHQENKLPSRLVEIVREATRRYLNVNAARTDQYDPLLGCVSGPDQGAMGIHYVNLKLVADGEIDANRPEALIYEPAGNGDLRLVGVEFIVDAAAWLAHHDGPPALEGQAFHLVNSPNRFGLPSFFELHVWAWRANPNGAYVDWHPHVSCEGR